MISDPSSADDRVDEAILVAVETREPDATTALT